MAVIPRYFSSTPATPAVSNAHIDPNVAAMPYKAAEQSTTNIMNAVQGELGQWHRLIQIKEKERQAAEEKNKRVQSGLYQADAMANLSIQSNKLKQDLMQRNDGSLNLANEFDAGFKQLADQVLLNAPDEQTKIALTKRIIGMRAANYNSMGNQSIRMNNQLNMDKMERTLHSYEGLAASNPEAAQELKDNAQHIFNSMGDLGIPEMKRQKIQNKFLERLDYQAAKAKAEQDPASVLENISSGGLAHLGEGNVQALKNIAKSSNNAYKSQAQAAVADLERRIMSGQQLPQDFQERLGAASKYGLHSEIEDISRLMKVDGMIAQSNFSELKQMKADLTNMLSSGEMQMDPKKAKKLMSFVDGNIKAMETDGFAYAESKGGFKPFNNISDFVNIDPSEIESRKFRAEQVRQAYGVGSAGLKQSEIDSAIRQLSSASIEDKVKILSNINNLGADTVRQVSAKLMKTDKGLAQALNIGAEDIHTAERIIQGQAVLAHKQAYAPTKDDVISMSDKAMKDMLLDDPEAKDRYIQAGKSIYAYEQSRGNPINFDEALAQAGNLIKVPRGMLGFSKYTTVAPGPDMSAKDFEGFLDGSLNSLNTWKKYGTGMPASADNRTPIKFTSLKPSDFDYKYNGRGFYDVYYEDKPVATETGNPLVIDLKQLYKDTQKGN